MKIELTKVQKFVAILFALPFFFYAGAKQGPVVVDKGINLTNVVVTSKYVDFKWAITDAKCEGKSLKIQSWNPSTRTWDDKATVDAGTTEYRYERFTVDKTYRWRISCDITEESDQ